MDILQDILGIPVSSNLGIELGYSKKKIEECYTYNKFQREEVGILELETSDKKKIKKIIVCGGNGIFHIRDLRRLKDKLEEYEKLKKEKRISPEEYKKLKEKAIKDELNSEI